MPDDYGIDQTALEQRIAEMSDEAFDALVARTRPPRLPKGTPVPGVGIQPRPPAGSQAIAAAEQSGDWQTAFDLKAARLTEMMRRK